jgi:hypothetical protein
MKKLLKKERALFVALERVKERLLSYKTFTEKEFQGKYNTLSEIQKSEIRKKIASFLWNDWHDLEYRISGRILDNKVEYSKAHFELHGWTILN